MQLSVKASVGQTQRQMSTLSNITEVSEIVAINIPLHFSLEESHSASQTQGKVVWHRQVSEEEHAKKCSFHPECFKAVHLKKHDTEGIASTVNKS